MSDQDVPAACVLCGARRDRQDGMIALAWTLQHEGGVARWLCGACSRERVRDIESKLPTEAW